jgi:plastocyanin
VRRPPAIIATAAVAVALTGGCGGGDGEEPGRTVTAAAGRTVAVTADEYSFDPETVVVLGAGRIEIALRNEGALAHNLRIVRAGRDLGGTPTFQGGSSRSAIVPLPHGTYEMVCTVGNHAQLGMKGRLEVR